MAQNLNLQRIKAIVYDIDGVLTDGSIYLMDEGPDKLVRVVNAKDSFASRAAASKGFVVGVISGADTRPLRNRCEHMGAKPENVHLGTRGKLKVFYSFCEDNGLKPEEVAFFGDDSPDTQVLRACGLGIAPADAAPEALEAADYICKAPGGRGCLREGIDMILKSQGKWQFDEDKFHLIY